MTVVCFGKEKDMWKSRKIRWARIKGLWLAVFVSAFFLPYFMKPVSTGDNIFYLFLNGTPVGVSDCADGESYVRQARREIAAERDTLVMMEAEVTVEGQEVLWGEIDTEETIVANMKKVMEQSERETLHRSYTVKINNFTVNLSCAGDVIQLLDAALDQYDRENNFTTHLVMDPSRELNVLTTRIVNREEVAAEEEEAKHFRKSAGMTLALDEALKGVEPKREKEFSEYELGLISLEYGDLVEVVETYLPQSELTSVSDAIEMVTKKQEKNKIYEVVSGDTLSEIAEDNGLTMEKLIAMNPAIENASSTIRVGDEIIVTSPEPELSVIRREQLYYEEDYDEEIIYIPNDAWYTTDQVTRHEPSAGHRKVVSVITYRNDAEVSVDIQKEEVTIPAVAKVVERGTKIPPSYIKPISGGRMSSGFGPRRAPTKGASTYHKGVDWAVPTGTAVMASSGGTIIKAGWGSGYGYVVYIDHGDGRQTRYAHLSKVLVKTGQKVVQGQKIALSGNTGRSTGPHLHFEILINGSHVNPMKHLS